MSNDVLATHEYPNGSRLELWQSECAFINYPVAEVITLAYLDFQDVMEDGDETTPVFMVCHSEYFSPHDRIRAMAAFVDRAFGDNPMQSSKFFGMLDDFLDRED